VVFAALFLGKRIPGLREIWRIAGPQVALGQAIAWGQYVVGLLLAIAVLTPVFGLPPLAGALIEIGFEGGHGTAAGLADTFAAFGFPEGGDLALGLATVGLVAGVLLGTVLVNWGVRTGRITLSEAGDPVAGARAATDDDLDDFEERERDERQASQTTDPLSIHVGYVAVAISLGWLLQQALAWVERATWGGDGGVELLVHLPLFPLAMLGGVALQLVLDRTGRGELVDRRLMNRISGFALDVIIVAALGTLSLDALGGNLAPFALLALAGIAWNVAAYLLLAPRIVPEHPYERGLGDFGQSMGMTVTGLLLMRIADPGNRSGGLEAFGYKQLLFEPVVGGGLFTAASVPLIAQFGPLPVLRRQPPAAAPPPRRSPHRTRWCPGCDLRRVGAERGARERDRGLQRLEPDRAHAHAARCQRGLGGLRARCGPRPRLPLRRYDGGWRGGRARRPHGGPHRDPTGQRLQAVADRVPLG
jgi:glutamate:Na+ symporter, ESS family